MNLSTLLFDFDWSFSMKDWFKPTTSGWGPYEPKERNGITDTTEDFTFEEL